MLVVAEDSFETQCRPRRQRPQHLAQPPQTLGPSCQSPCSKPRHQDLYLLQDCFLTPDMETQIDHMDRQKASVQTSAHTSSTEMHSNWPVCLSRRTVPGIRSDTAQP